ncbi:MAG: hypothetical protein UZ07_CHB004001132, partial [Chlorobi bacterium OLB7]
HRESVTANLRQTPIPWKGESEEERGESEAEGIGDNRPDEGRGSRRSLAFAGTPANTASPRESQDQHFGGSKKINRRSLFRKPITVSGKTDNRSRYLYRRCSRWWPQRIRETSYFQHDRASAQQPQSRFGRNNNRNRTVLGVRCRWIPGGSFLPLLRRANEPALPPVRGRHHPRAFIVLHQLWRADP